MNKEKLCGCGEKATIESTRKMIACSNCTIKFQKLEKDFESYQTKKRQKKNKVVKIKIIHPIIIGNKIMFCKGDIIKATKKIKNSSLVYVPKCKPIINIFQNEAIEELT